MSKLIPDFILDRYEKSKLSGNLEAFTMFADISGFSAMTQDLMAYGKEGAEILCGIINDIFTPSIQSVYKNGGFVSSFAGDAFTAIFQADDSQCPLRAGFEIYEIFQQNRSYETKYGNFRLSIKIGLSFGDIEFRIIETESRNTWYFRGKAIDGCAKAEHKAGKMQIIADKNIMEKIHSKLKSQMIEEKWFRIVPKSLEYYDISLKENSESEISSILRNKFVLHSVSELKDMGEFREIVSCFVNIAEEGDYHAQISEILRNSEVYGGYFNRVDFGDKGCSALILFGAPVGREKLYERACDFALSLRKIKGLKFRAGIAAGMAFAGFVGSGMRCEYTAMGNVVNLSARLSMKSCWSEIILSLQIADKLKKQYRLNPAGSFCPKGLTGKVDIYILERKVKHKTQFTCLGRYVGRRKETKLLKKLISPIFSGKFGGIIYIEGHAGIGKTRFISNFLRDINDKDFSFFYLACDEILKKAFNPFESCFKNYFDQDEFLSQESNKNAFINKYRDIIRMTRESEIKQELIQAESVIGALIGLEWEDSFYSQLDTKGRYENTVYAVKSFFKAVGLMKPLILVLEDVHWIDSDSKALIRMLVNNIENYPLCIIAVCRPNDDGREYNLILPDEIAAKSVRIKLGTLSEELVTELIKDKLRTNKIPQETSNTIFESSDGNPFFAEQMVMYLSENKLFNSEFGIIDKVKEIPSSIGQIIIARIDRLSGELKEAIKAASVLGREFVLNVLREMLIVGDIIRDDGDFTDCMDKGNIEQIWESISEISYIFKHALIRDAVYEIQMKKTLRRLHGLAGNIIEKLYQSELRKHYEELADHYDKAGKIEKAVNYLKEAGIQAEENYRNLKAIDFYSRLLKYLENSQDKKEIEKMIPILLKKGRVLELTGDWNNAEDSYRKAMQYSNQVGNLNLKTDCMSQLGNILREMGKIQSAEVLLKKSLKIAKGIAYKNGIKDSLGCIGNLYSYKGDYVKALDCYKNALLFCEQDGDKRRASTNLGNIGIIYYYQDDYPASMKYYKKQLSICMELNDKREISRALGNMGLLHCNCGDLNAAMELYQKQLSICEKLGDKSGISIAVGNMGNIYYLQQNYKKAMEGYKKKLSICQDLGDKWGVSVAFGNMGITYTEYGYNRKAMECFKSQLSLSEQIGDRHGISMALDNIGYVYFNYGEYCKAKEYYEQAISISRDIKFLYFISGQLFNKANLLYETCELDQAKTAVNEALNIAMDINYSDIIFKSRVLKYKINKNIQALSEMLKDKNLKKEHIAGINYELWKLTSGNRYKKKARDIYQKLLIKIPKFEYRKRIREMQNKK